MTSAYECFSAAIGDWRSDGDLQTVAAVLETATELDPGFADAWLARAACSPSQRATMLKRAAEAKEAVGRGFESLANPMQVTDLGLDYKLSEYVSVRIVSGEDVQAAVLSDTITARRFDAAEAMITSLPNGPLAMQVAATAAQLYISTGRWPQALAMFARSPELGAGRSRNVVSELAARQSAEAAARLGMFERAVEDADRTTVGTDLWRDAQYWKALSLRHLGRAEEARSTLDAVLRVFGDFEVGWAARNDESIGVQTTSAEAIAARTDPWDVDTEPSQQVLDAADVDAQRAEALAEADKMLAELIGMEDVKRQISAIEDTVLVRTYRLSHGEELAEDDALHLLLEGPPGVGKTKIARILALKFFGMGVVPANNFVETSRTDLEGKHLGDATVATKEFLEAATPGVAFVDEFHNLHQRGYSGGEDPYGNAMIAAINKYIDDHRDEMILIGAGYTDRVEEVLDVDAGLRGRFSMRVRFQSYAPDELADIGEVLAAQEKKRDIVTAESKDVIRRVSAVACDYEFDQKDKDGTLRRVNGIDHLNNARFVRRALKIAGEYRDGEYAKLIRRGERPPMEELRLLRPEHMLPGAVDAIRQIASSEVGNVLLTRIAAQFGVQRDLPSFLADPASALPKSN